MAVSENQPSPAPDTLNRGRNLVDSKRTLLRIPQPYVAAILWIMSLSIAGLTINEIRQIPPVHRAIDKAWDASLATLGFKANQDSSNTNTIGNNSNTEAK